MSQVNAICFAQILQGCGRNAFTARNTQEECCVLTGYRLLEDPASLQNKLETNYKLGVKSAKRIPKLETFYRVNLGKESQGGKGWCSKKLPIFAQDLIKL